MAKQVIDIGSVPDDGTGDLGRTAFDKTNNNFTELYGLILGGQFTSDVVDGSGVVGFNFDTDNAITTGSIFNFSSAGTDILSLLDDGTETTLKFHQANTFGNTNIETSSPLGEFTFKEAAGGTMSIDPQFGVFSSSRASMTFTANSTDVFVAAATTFTPGTTNTISLGFATKRWKDAFIVGGINFGASSQSSITFNTDGLTIANTAGEKLAFFNTTPIVQPATSGENSGHTAVGGTNVNHQDTFTGNVGATAYTINDVVKHLKNLGLIAL